MEQAGATWGLLWDITGFLVIFTFVHVFISAMKKEKYASPANPSKAALKWEAAKTEAVGWELGTAPSRGRKRGAADPAGQGVQVLPHAGAL